jgi:hypothetical protein
VLDPFCGVGSTCIAAIKAGRHFIGIDINLEYVEKAEKRISEYLAQTKLPSFVCNSSSIENTSVGKGLFRKRMVKSEAKRYFIYILIDMRWPNNFTSTSGSVIGISTSTFFSPNLNQ